MFTGLVREIGRVARLGRRAGVTSIDIEAPGTARPADRQPPAVGDSVAVNGICLTVVRVAGTHLSVEASAETRRVTTLGEWRVGTAVHLEPSLRLGDQLGGHFVLGHVDGTGRLVRLDRHGDAAWMTVEVGADLARGLLPKGSIAVDGVSLTLNEGPFADRFTVTLIPHTLAVTKFAALKPGARVNIELDVLTKAAGRAQGVVSLSNHSRRQAAGSTAKAERGGAVPKLAPRRTFERGASEGELSVETILARGWRKGTRHG